MKNLMNKLFKHTSSSLLAAVALFSFIGITNTAVAGKHIIMPQFGKLDLDNSAQDKSRRFDTGASSFFGFEYEAHILEGISLGGQYLNYRNKYTNPTDTYTSKSEIIFFNIKKYFTTSSPLSPFVGMGPGFATVSTGEKTSLLSSDFDGQVFKAMAGIAYDVEHVGFYLEYNKIFGEVDGDNNDTINVDSSSFIGGVRVIFGK